jgi:hypothetical protein
LASQLNRDDVCKALAQKYNELRKSRISADNGGIDRATKQLADVEQSISNIVRAIEQGAVSDVLIEKLKQLEKDKYNLSGKIKFLSGTDQNEIYITPSVIKSRFAEIPELLRTSKPFEVHKALRPLLGKDGIKLIFKTNEHGSGEHWAIGSLNLGRALTFVESLGYGDSASIRHEVSFSICLG